MTKGTTNPGAAIFIAGPWPVVIAWLAFTSVAIGTARNALRHLLCYSRPDLQQHVLRIILVGPLYAFGAALCLSLEESGCFFVRSMRDIWEAVVIYSFLTLIIEYMGGEHLCLHSISQREEAVPHLFPLNLCLPPIATGSMIRVPKLGALQFVVVKPILAAVSIVVYACGKFGDWHYQWTLVVIYNVSYSVALYALYLIYWASHEHPSLQAKRPLLKFLSVKMIVFLTFWQALLIPLAPLPGSRSKWEDFILAIEMTVFAILMNAAFSWQEFHSGLRGSRRALKFDAGADDKAQHQDTIDFEAATIEQPSATGQPQPVSNAIGRGQVVVQNAKAAFCPRDIIADASHHFSRRYQQHVLIESAQEYELRASEEAPTTQEEQHPAQPGGTGATPKAHGGHLRTFRARTYLIGRSLGVGGSAAGTSSSAVPAAGPVAAQGEGSRHLTPYGTPQPSPAIPAATALPAVPPLGPDGLRHVGLAAAGDATAVPQFQGLAGSDAHQGMPPPLHMGFEEEGPFSAPASPWPAAAAPPSPSSARWRRTADIGEPSAFGNPFA